MDTGIPLDVNGSPSSSTIVEGVITLQAMGACDAEGDIEGEAGLDADTEGEPEGNPMVPRKLYEHVGLSLTYVYPVVAPYE